MEAAITQKGSQQNKPASSFISVFPSNLLRFFNTVLSSSSIFNVSIFNAKFQASPAVHTAIFSDACLNTVDIFDSTFSDISVKISGIGSYVYLILVLNIFNAFLNSLSSFTLLEYFLDINIPINEHDKNINE